MVEVRLVGISVVECQINPVDVSLLADGKDDVLKALYTAEKFRSHPYFVAKELNEPPLAESDGLGDIRTAGEAGIFPKLVHGKRHRRVVLEWPAGDSQQPSFQSSEFQFDGWRFVQQAKQTVGARPPLDQV
jgi:hypothetical protein